MGISKYKWVQFILVMIWISFASNFNLAFFDGVIIFTAGVVVIYWVTEKIAERTVK